MGNPLVGEAGCMKWIPLVSVAAAALWVSVRAASPPPDQGPRTPVLVELFTSEGCSSCPPADALLQQLDRTQPVPGADAIVLSEHVDYWNRIGWKDPFSSAFFSDRQSAYASRFGLSSVYTPQMVVDGATEFTGSEANSARDAIGKAGRAPKLEVRLAGLRIEESNRLRASVEVDGALKTRGAEIFLVLALDHAESKVSNGENAGRNLSHVGVVKKLEKIGEFRGGEKFSKDIELKIDPASAGNLRLVAFVQEQGMGRVLGAVEEQVKDEHVQANRQ
jgi:hypothetical protein